MFKNLTQEVVVHVSASTPRLLIAAELMEMKKPYQDGTLREISVDDISHYKNSGQFLLDSHRYVYIYI